jgi:hypothetical protein
MLLVAPLLFAAGLVPSHLATSQFLSRASARLCVAPEDASGSSLAIRSYDKAEEKALRKTRLDFGGYPAGPYYTLEKEEGVDAAYAKVRSDHPVLGQWSDEEIRDTVAALKTTPAEACTRRLERTVHTTTMNSRPVSPGAVDSCSSTRPSDRSLCSRPLRSGVTA